jgi:hypothetical protein
MNALGQRMSSANSNDPRIPSKQEIRVILALIGTHFDEDKHCYHRGWSDARIGEELGLPPKLIEKVRDEYGLTLSMPPHLWQMQCDLDGFKDKLREFQKRLDGELAKLGKG